MRADKAVYAITVICKLHLQRNVDEDEKTETNCNPWGQTGARICCSPPPILVLWMVCRKTCALTRTFMLTQFRKWRNWKSRPGGSQGECRPRQHYELADRDNMCELPPCLARCTSFLKITKWCWLPFGLPNLVQIFLVANLNQKPKGNGYSGKCSST